MLLKDQKIETICIVMLGLLGDVLMRTPVLKEIKKKFPQAKVTVIVDPVGYAIFMNNPDVAHIIVMDRRKNTYWRYLAHKVRVQFLLWQNRFDLVIDLYGGKSSHNMAKLSGATYKIGFLKGGLWSNKQDLIAQAKTIAFKNPIHLTNQLFQILSVIDNYDCNQLSTTPILNPTKESITTVSAYVNTFNNNNFYVLSLGSGGQEKILDMEKQLLLILHIYKTDQLIPAIVLNPGQEHLQETLISKYLKPHNIRYIKLKPLNIHELAVLMKHSQFVCVPDSGLFHIAVAMCVPVLCIFTYTNPLLVQPDQGIYTNCFKATSLIDDVYQLPLGSPDIDEQMLVDTYASIKAQLAVARENNSI